MPDAINWWRTGFTEAEVDGIVQAIGDERLSQGAITEAFEHRFAEAVGARFAVATTSGSVALYLALKAVGVGPGDEVIVPNRTWVATAHAAMLAGATVALVDIEEHRPTMDANLVADAITERTKAILPVHLNGRACAIDALLSLARENDIAVIEDACQAMFSRCGERYLGTFGDAGCFSFGVTKLITTAQGGMVVTDNEDLVKALRLLRNHGVIDNFTEAWGSFGFNFKFTDIQAAAGLAQMDKLPERREHVRRVYEAYQTGFAGLNSLRIVPLDEAGGELPLYVEVLSDARDALIAHLKNNDIQARPLPPSLHTSDYFENEGEFARSTDYALHGFYLPCGPTQSLENVERVITTVRAFFGSDKLA